MCSVNETEFDDAEQYMENKPIQLTGDTCKKCNESKAEIVLRFRDAYCRECFLAAATHKFRSALGKSKAVRPKDHVLVAFSGSQPSTAMLHLVHAGLNEGSYKRLLFTCSVVYIDEGAVLELSSSDRDKICTTVIQHIKKLNLPLYITTLDRSLGDLDDNCYVHDGSTNSTDGEREEKLKTLITSVCSLTGKIDLLHKLRNQLLLKVAKKLKCNKIFSADTANQLAVKLLSNVALGRGAQLPLDIGFCDVRDPDVMLLRPMRDFMKEEVVFYNTCNKLESIFVPSLGIEMSPHASIQNLTEAFVTNLQKDFPATVSTIFRTGDKLSMGSSKADECCVLCQAPTDTITKVSSALQATEFSRTISMLGPLGFDSHSVGVLKNDRSEQKDVEQTMLKSQKDMSDKIVKYCNNSAPIHVKEKNSRCQENEGGCQCSRSSIRTTLSESEACFCYGCRLITREMETLEVLPEEVIHNIQEQLRHKEMRKEIEDFLL